MSQVLNAPSDALLAKAIVIKTPSGDRFFCGFGKGGRVQTAWSLAGSELFLHDDVVKSIVEKLQASKKKVFVVTVTCSTSLESIA